MPNGWPSMSLCRRRPFAFTYEKRKQFAELCPWVEWTTDRKPTRDEFIEVIQWVFVNPIILADLQKANPNLNPFKAFLKRAKSAIAAAAADLQEDDPATLGPKGIELLLKAGEIQLAKSIIVVRSTW